MPILVRSSGSAGRLQLLAALTLVTAVPLEGQRRPLPPRKAPAAGAIAPASPLARLSAADRTLLLRLLDLEDRRAPGAADESALLAAMRHRTPVLRRMAVRGAGRLQRPALADSIAPLTRDGDSEVRGEAINALAQALQGFRQAPPPTGELRAALDDAIETIIRAAERSASAGVLGVAARSLGRLPYADSSLSIDVARVILEMAERPTAIAAGGTRPIGTVHGPVALGVAHGFYSLARTRRVTGALPQEVIAWLREATTFRGIPTRGEPVSPARAAEVRRLAMLALTASGDTSRAVAQRAATDGDEQVRRLAIVYQGAIPAVEVRRALVAAALRDSSWLVRFEAVRAQRAFGADGECAPLVAAVADPSPHVALAAIDALGAGCAGRDRATELLERIAGSTLADAPTRTSGRASWQPHAHAVVALARVERSRALPLIRRDATHAVWQVRMYAARAAAIARDSATLTSLAADSVGGVREAALAALSATVGHAADRLYLAALSSPDYHVVLQGAAALAGTPLGDAVALPALDALDRLTAERRENSRDPRMALLAVIGATRGAGHAARLLPYASDFDSTVARSAATILERWTLRRVAATPKPLTPPSDPVSEVVGRDFRLRITMASGSGGGTFVVRLDTDVAPASVARIVRLAREGYYSGLTFHRVEPSFVIQGGSPKATEYVGDGPFMRDEVGVVSHRRGTLGISTRGRDTGDAQLFVNLTDNVRLDHDYTVLGEIEQGRAVAEGVLEGDVIERIEVVRAR